MSIFTANNEVSHLSAYSTHVDEMRWPQSSKTTHMAKIRTFRLLSHKKERNSTTADNNPSRAPPLHRPVHYDYGLVDQMPDRWHKPYTGHCPFLCIILNNVLHIKQVCIRKRARYLYLGVVACNTRWPLPSISLSSFVSNAHASIGFRLINLWVACFIVWLVLYWLTDLCSFPTRRRWSSSYFAHNSYSRPGEVSTYAPKHQYPFRLTKSY